MQPLIGPTVPSISQPGLPPPSGRAVMGVIGGIASAILGSAVPGAGPATATLIGTSLSATMGGSIGALFKATEEERTSEDWMKELSDLERARTGEGKVFMQSLGAKANQPGALGVPVPGLKSEAVRRFVS